jgi:hypothetical protein
MTEQAGPLKSVKVFDLTRVRSYLRADARRPRRRLIALNQSGAEDQLT